MHDKVENLVSVKIVAEFLLLLIVFCLLLFGCASSNVSRDVADNVDLGVNNAKNLVESDGSVIDSYENLSQTSKGAILGGAAGAIVGSMTPSAGVLPGALAGLILGASYGAYIDANSTLEDKLRNSGINLVELGDQILIVLPSARIFMPMTADIKQGSYPALNMVAEYINRYTKMLVKIAGYTNDTGSERVDVALSEQQAQAIAKFLMACGVDARLLYAVGYGGTNLVSKNTRDWDASDNYRIEITMEKLYV